jgi:hypothetical protein
MVEFGKKVRVGARTPRLAFNSIVGEGGIATVVETGTVVVTRAVGVMTGEPEGKSEVPVIVGVAASVVGVTGGAVVGATVGVFLTAGRGVWVGTGVTVGTAG